MTGRFGLLFASAGALALLSTGEAGAQQAGLDGTVAEVVVTAQKREQRLQDVPISLQVVSKEEAKDFHIDDILRLQENVPSLVVQRTPGNNNTYIRGFGSTSSNYAFDQSVSLYTDGVYKGRARHVNEPLFDIERVEVLRGPQGALLGKNTSAGAISVVSADPTRDLQAELTATANLSWGGGELAGFVSGPITDKLSGRVAVQYDNVGGYMHNKALDRDEPDPEHLSARVSLKFDPVDNLSIVAKLQVNDLEIIGLSQQTVPVNSPPVLTDEINAALPLGEYPNLDKQKDVTGLIRVDWSLGEHTLISQTSYNEFDGWRSVGGAGVNPEQWLSTFDEQFSQASQEVRLLSPTDGRFEYIVGLYYDTSEYGLLNISRYEGILGLTGAVLADFDQSAKTYSAYAQGLYHLTGDLRVQASARWTKNKKSGDFALTSVFGTPLGVLTSATESISESGIDPSLTVQYDVSNDIMLYATYAEGTKGGGFVSNNRALVPGTFSYRPENSVNYEAGIKSQWFDRRLTVNLTAFHLEFEDLQVGSFVPEFGSNITTNAATARSKGVEGMFEAVITDNFRIYGSGAYTDAKFTDFPGAQCPVGAPPGCAAATNNLAGYELPGTSKWSGAVNANYNRLLTEDLRLSMAAAAQMRGDFFVATDYSPFYGTQKGFTKYDARIEIADAEDRWSLALVGKNLTDEKTATFAVPWPFTASGPVAFQAVAETRSILLEARIRY